MNDNIYTQTGRMLATLGDRLPEGTSVKLPAVQLAHFPVPDTALAACLATLDIPFREPGPYTDDVQLDASGNETGRRKCWWLGDVSRTGEDKAHKTEELFGAWQLRTRFEVEHPLHPLVAMRAALDARDYWLDVLHGREPLPTERPHKVRHLRSYRTDSIHGASVLKACGFTPWAFTGRAFVLSATHGGVPAEQVLVEAAQIEGASPAQWMSRVLFNYSHLLKIAKAQSVILNQRLGDQSLLLTADSTAKTRDKFHALL